MSRYLFTCWPFVGHVYQQVRIGQALQSRGHDVAFYTGEAARTVLEQQGFTVFGFQRIAESRAFDWLKTIETGAPGDPRALARVIRVFREWLIDSVPDQVDDLRPILDAWQPDVLVTDLSMWAPILVLWETTGLPVALSSTFMGPLIPGPDAPPWGFGLPAPRSRPRRLLTRALAAAAEFLGTSFRRRVDELRARYGLPALGCSVNAFTARLPLYLVGNVPELDYDRHDLPPSVHYVGSCVWNKPAGESPPDWVDDLPSDQPWVHVTESTLHVGEPRLLRAAVEGLAHLPVQAILTTGRHRDPNALALGPLAPNIRVEQWVSHADLLPRCSAVVTSGGAATVIAAIESGVPLVVVPTTWDKPDNAQRVVEAGAGLRLAPRRCTPARLRAAVERVLAEPRFRANARRLARRFAAAPGPPRAAALLEALARPAPIPAALA